MKKNIFNNPIIPGFYPDPSICKTPKGYYLVCSSFEYFPGVPIFFSDNLYSWELLGYCLTQENQLDLQNAKASDGIYAPTIRYNDGVFYMITTNINLRKHILVTNTNPKQNKWSDPILLEQEGIDPSLFFDDDKKVYLTTSGDQRIVQSEIDIKTGKKISEEKVIWLGTGCKFPEGPHLYKLNDFYYLLISEGGTEYNHMVTVARSNSPFGPFKSCPHNPILSHAGKINQIQATGHADIVQDEDGNWFMVALGIRPNGYPPVHHLGRETFLVPFTFDDNNWPCIEDKCIPSSLQTDKRYINYNDSSIEDDFSGLELKHWWNFLRFSNTDLYNIDIKEQKLRLGCAPATIDSTDKQSFLGIRQRHFDCTFSVSLTFTPDKNEAAGICIRMNENHYYLMVLQKNIIKFIRKIGSLKATENQIKIDTDNLKLSITADRDTYFFYIKTDADSSPKLIGTGETRYLSTEVAGGFTGVYFGVYATADGAKSTNEAVFKEMRYTPKK